jgi:hypothetical protein
MTDQSRSDYESQIHLASDHMQSALSLLDKCGEVLAAAQLQQAFDTLEIRRVARQSDVPPKP